MVFKTAWVIWPLATSLIYSTNVFAETLSEALTTAYRSSPLLMAEREDVQSQDETYIQSIEAFGPTVEANLEADYQDARVSQLNAFGKTNISTSMGRTETAQLTFDQPIYSGGRLTAEINSSKAGILIARQTLTITEEHAMYSVIQAYSDVLRDLKILDVSAHARENLSGELEAIQAKFELGAATISDRAQVLARLRAAEIQLVGAVGQLNSSKIEYFQAVGHDPINLVKADDLPALPDSLEMAFAMGAVNSPGLKSASYADMSSQSKVDAARAAYLPSVSARLSIGSLPLDQYQSGLVDNNITAGIAIQLPVYSSGTRASFLRQAEHEEAEARLKVADARRSMLRDVGRTWISLITTRNSLELEIEQVRAEQVAYESLHEEYRSGLLSTIDLLNSEQELANTEIAVASAQHDAFLAQADVLQAIGILDAAVLLRDEPLYHPEKTLNSLKAHAPLIPLAPLLREVDQITLPRRIGASSYPTQSDLPVPNISNQNFTPTVVDIDPAAITKGTNATPPIIVNR